MRAPVTALALAAGLFTTAASAQVDGVNLNGRYLCVRACASDAPGVFAFIAQNRWDLNLVNEVGTSSTRLNQLPRPPVGRSGAGRRDLFARRHDDPVRQWDDPPPPPPPIRRR